MWFKINLNIISLSFFLSFFLVLWHINFHGLFNAITILVEEQLWYCDTVHFYFLSRGIILWIELTWVENPANTWAQHSETLDSSFDFIRSHQHIYIPWSHSLEIEPATTECRAKTLPLNHQSTSHISDAKSTSHGNCAAN